MLFWKKILKVALWLPVSGYAQFPFLEATIDDIQSSIKQEKYSCEQITQIYLNRIKASNLASSNGPPLNAFVSINQNIFQQAKNLDLFYQQHHELKGPLHCVPIVIKDNIDTYDSPTSVGTLALLGSQPPKDAVLVAKLRAAGAIILGKSTMDEFASGISGISGRSGRTGNAYQTSLNAGGSSAGSAVAVSANFAVIGIGTDNSGSVRIPGAYNGLYALRPTMGLISQQGIFPRGNLDGTAGPITRTVHDLAVVLDVIADNNEHKEKSYIPVASNNYLKGTTIGVLRQVANDNQFRNTPESVKKIYQDFIDKLKQQGANVIDNVNLPEFIIERKFNRTGEREQVNAYLKSFTSTRKDYQDICQSGRLLMTGGVNACLEDIITLPDTDSTEYQEVLTMFKKNRDYVHALMQERHLDALITPVDSRGYAHDDSSDEGINCLVASNAGIPALAIIAGVDATTLLPVSMELIGAQYEEKKLLEIALTIEKWQQRPIPTVAEEQNDSSLDIQEINNLITMIGGYSYSHYLKDGDKNSLTPEVFQGIVNKQKIKLKGENHPQPTLGNH